MKEATERQLEFLQAITDYIFLNGYPPTVREIAEIMGVAIRAAQENIIVLHKKGYIRKDSNKSRAIEVMR